MRGSRLRHDLAPREELTTPLAFSLFLSVRLTAVKALKAGLQTQPCTERAKPALPAGSHAPGAHEVGTIQFPLHRKENGGTGSGNSLPGSLSWKG